MSTVFETLNYTDLDFTALKARLQGLILSLFPDWPIDRAAEFGNILLDAFAFVGDITNFNNDGNYREAYVSTAQLLQSMLNLAEGLGVDIPLQEASTVDVVFSMNSLRPTDVLIPANTRISTEGSDPIEFRVVTAATILANTLSISTAVENSSQTEEEIFPTGISWFITWLSSTPFLRIESVVDSLGFVWTEQDSLIRSLPTDRHFETQVNAAGRCRIRFGNGIMGMIPNETMTFSYIIGGGSSGNVAKNTLTTLIDIFHDGSGNVVSLSVNNSSEASGGKDRITAQEAAMLIPASFRTQERTVSNSDFSDNAKAVAGVARAIMLTSNEDVGIEENMGHLIIVPEGGGEPSSLLKSEVLTAVTVDKPSCITFQTSIMAPIYLPINIVAVIFRSPNILPATAGATIRANLTDFFAISKADGSENTFVNFGGGYQTATGGRDSNLPYSDVYNVIRDSIGIRKLGEVSLNGARTDVPMYPRNFPILGTITLVDGDTGLNL
jgi:hypothetical protein